MNESLIQPTTLVELKTLTIPQLKSLCKEKGLTGYSKLTKDGIIRKLAPSYARAAVGDQTPTPSNGRDSTTRKALPISVTLSSAHDADAGIASRPSGESPTTLGSIQRSHIAGSSASGKSKPKTKGRTPSCLHDAIIRDCTTVTKRAPPKDITDQSLRPKGKFPRIPINASPSQQGSTSADGNFKLPALPPRLLTKKNLESQIGRVSFPMSHESTTDASIGTIPQARRFKSLVAVNKGNNAITTGDEPASPGAEKTSRLLEHPGCLELPIQHNARLKQITLPPSISNRKQAELFAIVLSGISYTDLASCSLVSRLFRYSAHLSAYHRLMVEFPGRRTEALFQQYNPRMTNMWPYLLQRQRELSLRLTYSESFLGRMVGDWYTLEEHLWASPDNPKQAAIAIRFILTRFYFLVSVYGADQTTARRKHRITDCQEIVENEIWTISVYLSDMVEVYHVLESTCEVIGCQDMTTVDAGHATPQQLVPRADWSSYIFQRVPGGPETTSKCLPLFEHLKWTNHEEYDKGISRHWLKRVLGEAGVGEAKIEIARRYILACVVENSVSGRWMSSVEMAQEFAGVPSTAVGRPKPRNQVQLYIPEHHYVEGIHLEGPKRKPLHAALAVVQTPAREYYILRDNGMQVGCEEDGVSAVWMTILGCCVDGTKV